MITPRTAPAACPRWGRFVFGRRTDPGPVSIENVSLIVWYPTESLGIWRYAYRTGVAIPGVEGVYDRHEYDPEKADALQRLANLIETIVNPPGGNVVTFAGAAPRQKAEAVSHALKHDYDAVRNHW
jgi:hypothetical protein